MCQALKQMGAQVKDIKLPELDSCELNTAEANQLEDKDVKI